MMNMLLPQYFAFRYPAKLFLVASLALSILAGVNFRGVRQVRSAWLSLGFIGLTGCGIVGFNWLVRLWMGDIVPDAMFGPFDSDGASSGFYATMVHSLVVGAIVLGLLLTINRSTRMRIEYQRVGNWPNEKSKRSVQFLSAAIVMISAVDVTMANRWLVPLIDATVFESENPVQERLAELRADIGGAEPIRVYRSTFDYFEPVVWERAESSNRLAEIVAWQRATLYPKHHLGEDVILLGSFSSIWPASYQNYLESFEWYRQGAVLSNGRPSAVLKMFHGSLESDESGELGIRKFQPEDAFGFALPIDWMFEFDPEKEMNGARLPRCLWNDHSPPSLRKSDEPDCRIIRFENNHFVAQVSTDRPKVLAFFAPVDRGWKVKVRDLATQETRAAELIELDDWLLSQQNRFDNTLLLRFPKSGDFEVEFTYSPREFWLGAWISGCSWMILGLGLSLVTIRKYLKR